MPYEAFKIRNQDQARFIRNRGAPLFVQPSGPEHQIIYYGSPPFDKELLRDVEIQEAVPYHETDPRHNRPDSRDTQTNETAEKEKSSSSTLTIISPEENPGRPLTQDDLLHFLIHQGGGYYNVEIYDRVILENIGRGREVALSIAEEALNG